MKKVYIKTSTQIRRSAGGFAATTRVYAGGKTHVYTKRIRVK